MRRTWRSWLLWAGLLVVSVSACGGPSAEPAVLSVSIDDGGRSVAVGGTLVVSASVDAVGGASQSVAWASSAPSVATVNASGLVAGVAIGQAQVTATSAFDASRSATVAVEVVERSEVLAVTIIGSSRVVAVGSATQYTVTVDAVGGADEAVTWRSSQPDVATVDPTGLVNALAVGVTEVSARSVFDPTVGDGGVTVRVVAPWRIDIDDGNGQEAAVGTAVATPPSVVVRDADGTPVPGLDVAFVVTAGGGRTTPVTPVATNASGVATLTSWVLGEVVGENAVRAEVVSDPGLFVAFTATGVAGDASAATSTVDADPTSLVADGVATSELTVRLRDAFGNALEVGGANVTFAAPSEGSIGAVTDEGDGTYSATYTAGTTAGVVAIVPSVDGASFTNAVDVTLTEP
ncbi:MAG: invasin domain 3-containing protein [Trueperaceae bacterium]